MTLAFSFGPWGGFDLWWGFSKSLTLGCLTITFLPVDFDALLEDINHD